MQVVGSVTKEISGITPEGIFALWADVNNWDKFNNGIEWAKLEGDFAVGNHFVMGLKNKKSVKIKIHEVVKNKKFVDLTVFPLAKMYGEHEIVEKEGRTFLTHAIKIDGLLSPLWRKLVANRVADKLEEDMDLMIGLAIDGKQHRF